MMALLIAEAETIKRPFSHTIHVTFNMGGH